MAETTCPTCGELVHVVATREGTNHYVSHWRIEWEKADRAFKQAERERDEAKQGAAAYVLLVEQWRAEATRLREALTALVDDLPWYDDPRAETRCMYCDGLRKVGHEAGCRYVAARLALGAEEGTP